MAYASSPTSSSTDSSTQTAVESPSNAAALYLPLDCLSESSTTRLAPGYGSEEIRSDRYWFEDGSVVFKVEKTLYKVYKGIFVRQSSFLASRITAELQSPPTHCPVIYKLRKHKSTPCYETVQPGPPRLVGLGSEVQPVVIDAAKSDFELLLSYMFPHDYEQQYSFSPCDWLGVTNTAKKLELKSIVDVATSKICQTASALELIDIGRKHSNHKCYLEGLRRLCIRESSLTVDEGLKLGVECVVTISQARDRLARGEKWSELNRLVKFRTGIEAKAKEEALGAKEKAEERAIEEIRERERAEAAEALAFERAREEASTRAIVEETEARAIEELMEREGAEVRAVELGDSLVIREAERVLSQENSPVSAEEISTESEVGAQPLSGPGNESRQNRKPGTFLWADEKRSDGWFNF